MAANRITFNKETLLSIPTPSNKDRETYYDTKEPCLALRVTKTGTKTFYVIKKIDGQAEWIKLDTFPHMTVEQARKRTTAFRAEINTGSNPAAAKRAIREEETFELLFEDFLKNRRSSKGKPLSDKTIAGYRSDWRNHLSKLGKKKISQVSEHDLSSIYNKLGNDHPTAANRVRSLASSMFSFAIETKRVTTNPVNSIPKRFAETKVERYLDSAEAGRFFAALGTLPENWQLLFSVSLLTGARRENVLAMRWPDIDMNLNLWWLDRTKGGKSQSIPLPAELIEMLRTWRSRCASHTWVFPSDSPRPSASGHIEEPKKRWVEIFDRDELNQIAERIKIAGGTFDMDEWEPLTKALKRAKAQAEKFGIDMTGCRMDHTRIHDLRHTHASWLINNGADLAVVKKALNHSSIHTSMRYIHLQTDAVRKANEKATNAIMAAAGLKPSAEIIPIKKAN